MAARPKILIVSDHLSRRDESARVLGGRGLDARVASTFELRFAAAGEQPDILLLDVGRLGPLDVAELVGDAAPGCPVVLLGDRSDIELRELAEASRAAAFVRAGAPDELADEIERHLAGGRQAATAAAPPVDFVALARGATRAEFVAKCPFPFLVSSAALLTQGGRAWTAGVLDDDVLRAIDAVGAVPGPRPTGSAKLSTPTRPGIPVKPATPARRDTPPRSTVTVLAVKKASAGADDAITVGRDRNVDIRIDHATVSKVHAHFARSARGLSLTDAGSRNGTWVAGRLLAPRGAPSLVDSGDLVRFGELEFTFLSAASAWDRLRVTTR